MATATGMVLSVAQTLLAALSCKELIGICSIFGYDSQLGELQCTLMTIKAVLLDVESKQQDLTNEGRDWVENLKDAVYDVDDLLDEFRTIALQRQQMKDAKLLKKVRRFFSRYNRLSVAFNASQAISKIRKKLDSISKNRKDFGFGDTYQPVKRKVETCSYVREESIIGREMEKEDIVRMLLQDSSSVNNQENVSFVTIVGMGGLGKTALAQLVFSDDRVTRAFELKFWVCVSEDFSIEGILSKILEQDGLNMEVLHRQVRQKIEGKKYLLVLDDVWNEDRNEWLTLRNFLVLGAKGSRILITSRSKQVARVLENNVMHELQVLSEVNSWLLFKKIAFVHGREPEADPELVEIGKEIVKRCGYVPLSIKVIGSLLFGQEKSKWLSFRSVDLSKMGQDREGIMPILMFSYYHLTPSLKTCFSYCALFPKDHVMSKQELINLWLALGCLEDGLGDGRCLEDVGEDNFSMLLQRCFLQDTIMDSHGEISSCKMHDLIHDLAQQIAGREVLLRDKTGSQLSSKYSSPFNKKIRHLFFDDDMDSLSKMMELRTFVRPDRFSFSNALVPSILAKCRRLRVLNFQKIDFNFEHTTLGKLIHLRYLNLSSNDELEALPESITKLLNLQVLDLGGCRRLKELPKGLKKLVNLRHLNITDCDDLTHMPTGMGSLLNLHTLTVFVLGGGRSNKVQNGQLIDMKPLTNLRGELHIKLKSYNPCNDTMDEGGRYLENKAHLKAVKLDSELIYDNDEGYYRCKVPVDERFLENLKPHRDVRRIEIKGYEGVKLPPWGAKLTTSLPYLVYVDLYDFRRLQHVASLSRLRHLKILKLGLMPNVEYIEDDDGVGFLGNSAIFHSLDKLQLYDFPKLKGWWRDHDTPCSTVDSRGQVGIPSFPHLHTLEISRCPSMTSFPRCPHLKKVELLRFNDALTFHARNSTITASSSASGDVVFNLEGLLIDNVNMLNFLFGESLSVTSLRIFESEVVSFSSATIENLRGLQTLAISGCSQLVFGEDEDEMRTWKALHSLSRLELAYLPELVNLPKGLQYLTSLQSLQLHYCYNLEVLPEWIDCLRSIGSFVINYCPKLNSLPEAICRLSSLTHLQVSGCDSSLSLKCQEPDGEYWPKICHIPNLDIW